MTKYRDAVILSLVALTLMWFSQYAVAANCFTLANNSYKSGLSSIAMSTDGVTYISTVTNPVPTLRVDSVTPLISCYYLALSGAEYAGFIDAINVNATQQITINNLVAASNDLQTRITNLETWKTSATSSIDASTTNATNAITSVANVNAILNSPFDLQTAMAGFAFFFSTVIFFYAVARGAGAVLETIKPKGGT